MTTRERNPFLAGLASFFITGLGQLYVGRPRKGLAFLGATAVLSVALAALVLGPFGAILAGAALLAAIAVQIASIVDAARTARREGSSYVLRPYNRVWVYLVVICAVGVGRELWSLWVRERVIQAFRVPSEGMLPTQLVGDYFFVDKGARRPAPGDVIVFRYPPDPRRDYVKRCVAVGGQTVEVRDKIVWVDGRATDESKVVHIDAGIFDATTSPRDNFGPYVVPARSYFVMGDNRDNSNDSRFWGPVPEKLVLGTARWIYWSWDAEKSAPRWERIGSPVR